MWREQWHKIRLYFRVELGLGLGLIRDVLELERGWRIDGLTLTIHVLYEKKENKSSQKERRGEGLHVPILYMENLKKNFNFIKEKYII